MELPINTIVILVVLLVLVVVVLILVSRGGSNFTDFGEDKIEIAGDVSEYMGWATVLKRFIGCVAFNPI